MRGNPHPKGCLFFWRSIATALPVALFLMIVCAWNAQEGFSTAERDVPPAHRSQNRCAVGLRFWRPTSNPSLKRKNRHPKGCLFFWRSGRDLNPRAAFDDNTISSRARYDHFDTTAYEIALCNTAKIIIPNSAGLSSKKTENLHVFSPA